MFEHKPYSVNILHDWEWTGCTARPRWGKTIKVDYGFLKAFTVLPASGIGCRSSRPFLYALKDNLIPWPSRELEWTRGLKIDLCL